MNKNRGFILILIPAATVFFSSACIMVLELVASRLIAKHLGSSLYTWTSVIGIVLAGITVGNYLGGRIADRFPARKTLAVLLGVSSVACVVIVILNNLVGDWIWLWKLSWPAHVLSHVFLVFMLPSTLLGTVSPVVAKMALDKGLPTGRTVGDIYAFGAAGSIAGTFLAGFYLIAAMGTIAIIWSIGAALLLLAILFWPRLWLLYIWAVIFVALMTMGRMPLSWAKSNFSYLVLTSASSLALRAEPNPNIVYEDESQYSNIVIKRDPEILNKRIFLLDKLIHSKIIMDDILDLQYPYSRIYAAITGILSQNKNTLSFLTIGGGGYVFPRFIEKVWPGSRVDVVEIDPRVTKAAIQAFGLDSNTTINTYNMDARNYIDGLLKKKVIDAQMPLYDFIYEDAVNDYSVPYQLTTKEFNDKIAQILNDDGVYLVNIIEAYRSGLFLGAVINTLQQTFLYVYVITEEKTQKEPWGTFVIIAAKKEINLEKLHSQKSVADLNLSIYSNAEIEEFTKKEGGIVLTDDFAPVENLLAPVVRQSAIGSLPSRYLEWAMKREYQGRLDESLALYKEVIKLDPAISITAYNYMGQVLAKQGKWKEALDAAKSAIEYNEKASLKHTMADMYLNVGMASKKLGMDQQASDYILKAIDDYQKDLTLKPNSIKTLKNLGNALFQLKRFNEASEYLQRAVDTNPLEVNVYLMLADALSEQQRYDDAITALRKAIAFFSNIRTQESINNMAVLQKYLWSVEDKKNTNKQ